MCKGFMLILCNVYLVYEEGENDKVSVLSFKLCIGKFSEGYKWNYEWIGDEGLG